MPQRMTSARSQELVFAAMQTDDPAGVLRAMRKSPEGATAWYNGVEIRWGNVRNLLRATPSIEGARWPRVAEDPIFVCHVDRLSAPEKRGIEKRFSLPPGSISGSLTDSKVDVLLVRRGGQPVFTSLKVSHGHSKLGQVSSDVTFGLARLSGGLRTVDLSRFSIPSEVTHDLTSLSERKFQTLTAQQRSLAFVKRHFPIEWDQVVASSLRDARNQLLRFCLALSEDRRSFLQFLGMTLAGNLHASTDFRLIIDEHVVNLGEVLNELESLDWTVTFDDASSTAKFALVLKVARGSKNYNVTRIEPAFDGQGVRVIQTKGVIYYFQEHSGHEANSYKDLLISLSDATG